MKVYEVMNMIINEREQYKEAMNSACEKLNALPNRTDKETIELVLQYDKEFNDAFIQFEALSKLFDKVCEVKE